MSGYRKAARRLRGARAGNAEASSGTFLDVAKALELEDPELAKRMRLVGRLVILREMVLILASDPEFLEQLQSVEQAIVKTESELNAAHAAISR